MQLAYRLPQYGADGALTGHADVAVQDGQWYGLFSHTGGKLRFGAPSAAELQADPDRLRALAERQSAVAQDPLNTKLESVTLEVRDWELPLDRTASVELSTSVPRTAAGDPMYLVRHRDGSDTWLPWGHPDGAVGATLPFGKSLPDLAADVERADEATPALSLQGHPALQVSGTTATLPLLNYDQLSGDERVWITATDGDGAVLVSALQPSWKGGGLEHFPGSNLAYQDISEVQFDGSDLTGSNLFGATLSQASLLDADVEDADMRGVAVDAGTDLRVASLQGVRLRRATSDGAALPDGASWVLQPATGTYAAVGPGVDLSEADLRSADFDGRSILGGSLHLASVAGGRFTGLKAVGTEPVPLRSLLAQHTQTGEWSEGDGVESILATADGVTTVTWDGAYQKDDWGYTLSSADLHADAVVGASDFLLAASDTGADLTSAPAVLMRSGNALAKLRGAPVLRSAAPTPRPWCRPPRSGTACRWPGARWRPTYAPTRRTLPSQLTFEGVPEWDPVSIPFVKGFRAVVEYAFFAPAASDVSSTLQAEIDKGEDVSFKAQDGLFGDRHRTSSRCFGACATTSRPILKTSRPKPPSELTFERVRVGDRVHSFCGGVPGGRPVCLLRPCGLERFQHAPGGDRQR